MSQIFTPDEVLANATDANTLANSDSLTNASKLTQTSAVEDNPSSPVSATVHIFAQILQDMHQYTQVPKTAMSTKDLLSIERLLSFCEAYLPLDNLRLDMQEILMHLYQSLNLSDEQDPLFDLHARIWNVSHQNMKLSCRQIQPKNTLDFSLQLKALPSIEQNPKRAWVMLGLAFIQAVRSEDTQNIYPHSTHLLKLIFSPPTKQALQQRLNEGWKILQRGSMEHLAQAHTAPSLAIEMPEMQDSDTVGYDSERAKRLFDPDHFNVLQERQFMTLKEPLVRASLRYLVYRVQTEQKVLGWSAMNSCCIEKSFFVDLGVSFVWVRAELKLAAWLEEGVHTKSLTLKQSIAQNLGIFYAEALSV